MSAAINLAGQRFGRLVVLRRGPIDGRRRLVCRCDCGTEKLIARSGIISGQVVSCGCYRLERMREILTSHGETCGNNWSPEYRAWVSMKTRCKYKNRREYRYYGGAGVTVCPEWLNDFSAFLAHVGRRPSVQHSLDRFPDPCGNYEPGNVRWATDEQQGRNKRNGQSEGHCKNGHAYTPDNIRQRISPNGKIWRCCLTCNRGRDAAGRQKVDA